MSRDSIFADIFPKVTPFVIDPRAMAPASCESAKLFDIPADMSKTKDTQAKTVIDCSNGEIKPKAGHEELTMHPPKFRPGSSTNKILSKIQIH